MKRPNIYTTFNDYLHMWLLNCKQGYSKTELQINVFTNYLHHPSNNYLVLIEDI